MGRVYIAKGTSALNGPMGVGKTATEMKNRPVKIHGYSVASRGADFPSDMIIDLVPGYTSKSSTLNRFTGAESLATAVYTSDFSTDAQSWTELTNNGLTFAGNIDKTDGAAVAKTDTLRVTADAGGDLFDMKKASVTTNAKYYKVTFSFMQDTGGGLSYLMLGNADANDQWDQVYDHDAGNNVQLGAENTWADYTLYGKADGTTIEISAVTGAANTTQDTLGASKNCYFHNIVVREVQNVSDAVPSAETHFGWDGTDQEFSCDAGNGGTITWTHGVGIAGGNPATGNIYEVAVTQADYVAQSITVTAFGDAAWTIPAANGTYTNYFECASNTNTFILTADGTGDGGVDTVTIKKLNGVDTDNSIYHHVIQAGQDSDKLITFPAPVYVGSRGWWMQFSPAGTNAYSEINVFYEIM